MISKKIIITGLIAGSSLLVGTTVFALNPQGFEAEAFSSFSADQQTAIQNAHDIMHDAEEQAHAVLDAAGVDRQSMHEAMQLYRKSQNEKFQHAIASDDYATFVALVAGTPMADSITEADFKQLVEAYKLKEAGDIEGARAIIRELGKDVGFLGDMRHAAFGAGPRGERMHQDQ